MVATLAHRGPDGDGTWIDDAAGLALGHRRLAILDPSPQGHQPMASRRGRHVLAFNGEIYNHKDIRAALDAEGAAGGWRGGDGRRPDTFLTVPRGKGIIPAAVGQRSAVSRQPSAVSRQQSAGDSSLS